MTVDQAYIMADICVQIWADKLPEPCERAWFREGTALWMLSEPEAFRRAAWPGVKGLEPAKEPR
jgi:hypothetical protein